MRPKSLAIPLYEFAHAAHTPRVRGDPAIAAKKRGGRRFQFCDTGPTATPSTRSLRILLTAMPGIETRVYPSRARSRVELSLLRDRSLTALRMGNYDAGREHASSSLTDQLEDARDASPTKGNRKTYF